MYNRYYPYYYSRSEKLPATLPPPPKHCATPKNSKKPPKKKLDFKTLKKDTCTSLNDVEYFLNNFSQTWKYIKLIKLLK